MFVIEAGKRNFMPKATTPDILIRTCWSFQVTQMRKQVAKIGWLLENKHDCGNPEAYNEHWDAEFCPECDVWLSKKCGMTPEIAGSLENARKECWVECWNRPDKPSMTED